MRDFLDRKILVGDTVVYPHRTGSLMVLKKATVTAFGSTTIHGTNENGRHITLMRPERCVSIPAPSDRSFAMTYSKE